MRMGRNEQGWEGDGTKEEGQISLQEKRKVKLTALRNEGAISLTV
jgi:hypothetical protein